MCWFKGQSEIKAQIAARQHGRDPFKKPPTSYSKAAEGSLPRTPWQRHQARLRR
jgi:hypothetical protein